MTTNTQSYYIQPIFFGVASKMMISICSIFAIRALAFERLNRRNSPLPYISLNCMPGIYFLSVIPKILSLPLSSLCSYLRPFASLSHQPSHFTSISFRASFMINILLVFFRSLIFSMALLGFWSSAKFPAVLQVFLSDVWMTSILFSVFTLASLAITAQAIFCAAIFGEIGKGFLSFASRTLFQSHRSLQNKTPPALIAYLLSRKKVAPRVRIDNTIWRVIKQLSSLRDRDIIAQMS